MSSEATGSDPTPCLSDHYPVYIDPAADARIREKFPIMLAPEDMKPGNPRW